MEILIYIIVFTLLGSVLSLVGGILLLANRKIALKASHFLSAFAAGTLLGTAFLDLLPEAFEVGETSVFIWTLLGVLAFFLIERFIHHHDKNGDVKDKNVVVPLIVLGDSIHNLIDGVAIAVTFLINIPLGIVTTLAVAAHEIPQEIGDFGLMVAKGVKRSKILWINLLSSLSALFGALVTFMYKDTIVSWFPVILAVSAGFFIYIALANLIPEIHSQDNKRVAFWETIMLFVGVFVIYLIISSLGGAH